MNFNATQPLVGGGTVTNRSQLGGETVKTRTNLRPDGKANPALYFDVITDSQEVGTTKKTYEDKLSLLQPFSDGEQTRKGSVFGG